MRRTPRADKFEVMKASDSLRDLAESKNRDALLDAADCAYADPEQVDDMFSEGIRIGLMMAAQGRRTAVEVPVAEEGVAVFVGTPREVRARIAALEDAEGQP